MVRRIESIRRIGSLSGDALERFVYVVGTARGGTTIVRNAIGIHDNILMLPGMTHFVSQVWRYRKTVHMRLLRQIFRMPGFYREKEVIGRLDQVRGAELRKLVDRCLSSNNLKYMWQIYPLVYGLDERNQKNVSKILCWGDKTNDCRQLGRIYRSFDKGKFVFVVRDPRDAVSSMAKRSATRDSNDLQAPIEEGKIVEFCVYWRNMVQSMLRFFKRYPERTVMVRFEEFVSAPGSVLNGIFRFVVGRPMVQDEIDRRLRDLAYRVTNDPSEKGSGISVRPVGRWKEVLNAEQVHLIGALTGVTARKLGYDVSGSMSLWGYLEIMRCLKSVRDKAVIGGKLAFLGAREELQH